MSTLNIFGIGSLVNVTSIAVPVRTVQAASITGWSRAWNQRFPMRGGLWSTLGIQPAEPNAAPMLGALLTFDGNDEPYFRERESGYDWVEVAALTADGQTTKAWTFAPSVLPTEPTLIPLSYILTVMEGFDVVHPKGADAFVANTLGWENGVIDDCAEPYYPRHPADIGGTRARYLPVLLSAGVHVQSGEGVG